MRIRWISTIAAAFAVICLLPAGAGATWTLKGHGYGHGIGLSQYGAYGFAKHGASYKKIIDHYYVRTNLGKATAKSIRVLLGSGSGSVKFSGAGKACGTKLNRDKRYVFVSTGGGVSLRKVGGGRLGGCGREGKAAGRTVKIGGHGKYRGALVARADGGGLLVINQVGLEGYVKGVVPGEVPASWPAAALRAQAVVARSYGLATKQSGAFDQYSDTRSQVYAGRSAETKETNKAVEATAGEVVKYNGKVAVTYYFSTSGGRTENSEFGFSGGSKVPYLKSVKDPHDDTSPLHNWRERLSDSQMESELTGLFSGNLKKVDVIETGKSPRIVRARVVGSRGSTTITGDTLRARLGLRSTWVRFSHR